MEATRVPARTGTSPCAVTAVSRLAQRNALRGLALTFLLFAALALTSAQSASACVTQPFSPAPLTNNFEGADGDQCDSDGAGGPQRDWQNVVGEDGFVGTDDEPSDADTIYGSNNAGLVPGATDETKPDSWNFTIGNLGGSKFDALSAFSFTDPISDKLFVDLAFVRATATGATFLAFELNQRQPGYRMDANEADATKPFAVPTRTEGDLLVTYDVNNAGAITLGLCIWDGDEHAGRWEEFAADLSGDVITNQPCPALSSTLYQAALNDALSGRQGTIPAAENFLTSGDIGQGRFGEAVVNLTDALRDPVNPTGPQSCIDFGYVWMHSRSSDSLTSAQQDFILPADAVSIGNCSVEGRKFNDANGNGADDGAANGEPGLGGWTIFVDYDGDGVLDNDKDATFVNDMDGVVEAGEEEPYAVTADGSGTEPLGHYRITDVQRTTNAPGGVWQVREVLQPAWDCTAAIGGGNVAGCPEKTDTDPDSALGFQLSWANNDIHTGRDFGNKRRPATLKVVKHVVNDNGGTAVAANWSLHVKSGADDVAGSPQAGDENGDIYTLTAGQSYDVSETGGPSGYAATFSGDCDANGSVAVAAGVQKVCTITNDDVAPKVKVVKHVVNDNGGTAVAANWQLHLKSGASDVTGSPQAGDENGDTYTVAAGSYTVSETGGPSGYAATFSGDCSASGALTVSVGQEKTCTITNDDVAPGLTVIKHVVNDNGGTAVAANWQLHVKSGASDVTGSPQAGDENGDTYTLPAGAYKVSETGGPSGYAATFSGDCDADGDVTISVGEAKTCTITNDDVAPKVKVVKHVVNDNGGAAAASDWQLHLKDGVSEVTGSPQPGDENGDTYTVAAGAYKVSETGGPSGYAATFSGDCDADGDVTVAVGQEKVCTITNNDVAPRLTVVKHVVNKGGSTAPASAFQMDVTATNASNAHFPGSETGTTITLDAGPYSVDESGGPSTFEKALSADCAGTIAVGQEKTCTITNTKILPGGVVIKKGPAYAYHGDTLNFTFEVTNPGTTPLATVNVSDDKCAPVVGPTQKLGGNQDAKLDAGETWVYTCTMQVPAHGAGDTSLVNTVTLAAADADGEPVRDTDQHTTLILHPEIHVDKTGPATAQAGQPVAYTIDVTNPGDVPFLAQNVGVQDALCQAPPLLTTKNGDPSPGQLDPGDKWTYTCTVQTAVGQTVVNNVAVASATDSFDGHTVTDDDPATTQLTQPPAPPPPPPAPPAPVVVGPASVPVRPASAPAVASGTARLSGPSRCVSGSFNAAVRGRNISQVLFMLDGKKLRTVRSRPGRTLFSVRIDPRGQSYRAHRVVARVSFRASANTPSRTLRMVYVRCARVAPKFTG